MRCRRDETNCSAANELERAQSRRARRLERGGSFEVDLGLACRQGGEMNMVSDRLPSLPPHLEALINGSDRADAANEVGPTPQPFPKMEEAAYHGLAGDIVRAIDPHTEADPVAVLAQSFVYFGSII